MGGIFSLEARDMDTKLLSAPELNNTLAKCWFRRNITSSGWPFVSTVLGQMAHLVANITLNSARSCVMQSAFLTQGTVSSISIIFSWGSSISPEGFLSSILLWLVIIIAVVDVTVVVVIIVAVVVESSSVVTNNSSGERILEDYNIGDSIADGGTIVGGEIVSVLDLEKTKTTQQNEIASLKRRVKKLEKKSRSRTHKLKRLYKVGLTARVESSGDEEDLGKDASKQGRRINAIDADEDITLVNVQDDADNEMFDVNALHGEEVLVTGQNENVVEEVVDVVQVSTTATIVTITTLEITLAQALEALKTSKLKDKGKGIMIEEHVKPMKKKVKMGSVYQLAERRQALRS
ncbi:hypothetical protein Tco_0602301 [Tanacetum coccineum]